jgi:hypothetical protein
VIMDLAAGDEIHLARDINGSGIESAADLASLVTGDATSTTITIGTDTIRIQGMDKDEFLSNISNYVKIVG